MAMPPSLDYPIIAIADLHGQLGQLKRLIEKRENLSTWDDCALVFLGDFIDRGEDVKGTRSQPGIGTFSSRCRGWWTRQGTYSCTAGYRMS
jgi:Calcineurin-like phosphoesterase